MQKDTKSPSQVNGKDSDSDMNKGIKLRFTTLFLVRYDIQYTFSSIWTFYVDLFESATAHLRQTRTTRTSLYMYHFILLSQFFFIKNYINKSTHISTPSKTPLRLSLYLEYFLKAGRWICCCM